MSLLLLGLAAPCPSPRPRPTPAVVDSASARAALAVTRPPPPEPRSQPCPAPATGPCPSALPTSSPSIQLRRRSKPPPHALGLKRGPEPSRGASEGDWGRGSSGQWWAVGRSHLGFCLGWTICYMLTASICLTAWVTHTPVGVVKGPATGALGETGRSSRRRLEGIPETPTVARAATPPHLQGGSATV